MLKTATITARIKPELKESTEKIFNDLGLTSTEAITLFLKQVELHRGLPFSVRLPGYNAPTMHAIQDASEDKYLSTFDNPDELFRDLEI